MLDYSDIIVGIFSLLLGGGASFAYITWLTKDTGAEPVFSNVRKNREPHEHHYDTMDASTKGKYVCGTCRKVNPRG